MTPSSYTWAPTWASLPRIGPGCATAMPEPEQRSLCAIGHWACAVLLVRGGAQGSLPPIDPYCPLACSPATRIPASLSCRDCLYMRAKGSARVCRLFKKQYGLTPSGYHYQTHLRLAAQHQQNVPAKPET